ncbi:extracellular solute-binding protein [Aureibacillus halotolerans]|uniref:Carbohydrate ABC transporter substrate-binding protein (CUT1 family) n=1 Tax=Aureibacillus halotolerans TaxID=1508390 RepID=A0A4R6UD13_9BACI|nr:extracellular solute-binding protein [Aureibacillus halotolerans]TDQ42949.1 carbohydrate ABC transporter substrate-binding protein (CUT1 family) [Aureibacillus halotolerans]
MKPRQKFAAAVFSSLFGIAALAGCASNESASNGGDADQTDQTEQSEAGEASSEPFAFSIMANLHTPEVPDDKILNALEESTNTEIEIQWVPDNTYVERLNSAFATNSFADAVFMKNQTTFVQFKEAIRDDQFWEIGPYMEQFENLSKLDEQVLANTMVDGKLYSIYQARPLSRQGLIYRKDWADNLGLEAPETTEDFYEMMRAFTEDDPDGDGQDDTIGLTDRSDLVYGAFKTVSSWFNTPNNWGEQDGKLMPEFMFPEYKQTMDYFKDLHENKYMNQDFPVTSKTDQQTLFKNGTAGAYIGSMGDVLSLYEDAKELNPDIEFGVHNQIKGPNGEYQIWAIPGYGNMVMFPKSKVESEEELLKILGFFDALMTPENANLLYWGIEGENYEVVDGRANVIADSSVQDREVKPFQSIEVGGPETNGRYEGVFPYEAKEKAEELIKDNENYLIHDPTVALDSETFIENGERLNQIIQDATWKYMIGQIDEAGFESAVEDWKNQGGTAVIEEYNASYEELNSN